MSCLAVWTTTENNESELICKTIHHLDSCINKTSGIQYFISSITGATTSSKKAGNITRCGVAYIIICRKNSEANGNKLFTLLHDNGTHASVTHIHTKKGIDEKSGLIQGL